MNHTCTWKAIYTTHIHNMYIHKDIIYTKYTCTIHILTDKQYICKTHKDIYIPYTNTTYMQRLNSHYRQTYNAHIKQIHTNSIHAKHIHNTYTDIHTTRISTTCTHYSQRDLCEQFWLVASSHQNYTMIIVGIPTMPHY